MPKLKISCVVSFSSEDSSYPASNLLSNDIAHSRWIGQKGENSNSVVLQLEKSTQITSVSIGTYHSALVEVLVGRSEATGQPFEVLICASSFMNPSDSRNSENISRVRTFSKDQMVPGVQVKKWDRIRIVCTQPFNKHVQFGLSFIEIYNTESSTSNASGEPQNSSQTSMLGRFKLRDLSSDEEDSKPGELFARFKQKGLISTDAQIRKASSPLNLDSDKKDSNLLVKASRPQKASKMNDTRSNNDDTLSRRRDELFYNDEDDEKNDKIDRVMKRDRDDKAKEIENKRVNSEKKPKRDSEDSDRSRDIKASPKKHNLFESDENESIPKDRYSTGSRDSSRSSKTEYDQSNRNKEHKKRHRSPDNRGNTSAKKQRHSDPDNPVSKELVAMPKGPMCLKGVVFVLSGYVNPKRSTLRDIALSLGARYSPDWGPNCTHLVCAFANTPKHDQVRKSGTQAGIVSGQWIEDCKLEQACLPWKWYALDAQHKIARPKDTLPKLMDAQESKGDLNDAKKNRQIDNSKASTSQISDDEMDTDEEIEKVKRQNELKKAKENESPKVKANKAETSQKESKNNSKTSKNVYYDSDSSTDIDEGWTEKCNTKTSDSEISTKTEQSSENFNSNTVSSNDKNVNKHQNENSPNATTTKFTSDEVKDHKSEEPFDDLILKDALPDLFSGIKFYIDPNLTEAQYDIDEVKRYVLAYKGEVLNAWPNKAVDVAVTTEKWAEELRNGKAKKCQFMRPEWVWKCNDTRELFAFENYIIA